jgi:MYXO-CTERM domain-containing protein
MGKVLDNPPVLLSGTVKDKYTGGVAFDGTNYLVAFADDASLGQGLYAVRVSATGTLLDVLPILIPDPLSFSVVPQVAFDGTNYFVVWEHSSFSAAGDIYGARISPAGVVLDATPIQVSVQPADQWSPTLSFSGGQYLVAWADARGNSSGLGIDVYATRVTPAGTVLDPDGFAVVSLPGWQVPSAIASDGTNFLVAWSGEGNQSDVYAARVNAGGQVLDAGGIPVCVIPQSTQINPMISWDGTNYLLAWTDDRSGKNEIYGARVAPTGTVLEPNGTLLYSGATDALSPVLAFDGKNHVMVFQSQNGGQSDLLGMRISPANVPVDAAPFVVANAPTNEGAVGLATGAAGQLLVTYNRNDPSTNSQRPMARLIGPDPLGASCALDVDCASGYCVDGVCCDTACGGGSADCQACSKAAGAPADGTCAPLTGASCDDGNGCTKTDTCQAGACKGANPVVCDDPGPCQAAMCDPATGACSATPLADGSACPGGVCQGGMCMPSGSSSGSTGSGGGSGGGGGNGGGSGSGSGSGGGSEGGGGSGTGGAGGSGNGGAGGTGGGTGSGGHGGETGSGGNAGGASASGSGGSGTLEGGGCGCRTASGEGEPAPYTLALGLGMMAAAARRRRRSR